MMRKFKIFGSVAAALFAMSVFAASGAHATKLTSSKGHYPTFFHAGQTTTHEFVINGRTYTCAKLTFTGTLSGATSTPSVTPSYEECHTIVFGNTWPVTMTTEDCSSTLTETSSDKLTLDCPAGKNATIRIYTSHANHTSGTTTCIYHIEPQTISTGVSIANNVDGKSVDVSTSKSPVALTLTSGSVLTCGATNQTGSYTGTSNYKGTSGSGSEGIHFASPVPLLTGAKGGYPVTLHGGQTTTHEIGINGRTITCATVTFAGNLTEAEETQSVTPAYETCHTVVLGITWPVTITTGGCTYTLTERPSDRAMLDCPSGKNTDIHVYESHSAHTAGTSVCTYHIGPQTISTGTSINNYVDGQRIDVSTMNSPVAITLTSGTALTCGETNQTANYIGTSIFSGTFYGAEGIHSDTKMTSSKGNYPVALQASQTTHELVLFPGTVTCSVTFVGSISEPTENASVTPDYTTCHMIASGITLPVTVTVEECTYTLAGAASDKVTSDCPVGKTMNIHVFGDDSNHKAGTSLCTYHIGPQTISTGVSISNNADGKRIDVSTASSQVAVTKTSGSTIVCGPTNQTGSYTGTSTYSGSANSAEGIHWKE